MDRRPQRSVEQIEVIEHRIVEEGRRPVGTAGALPPYSTVRRSTESYETRDVPLDRRYDFTGERDVSRDASFLHTSASEFKIIPEALTGSGQQIEVTPTRSQLYTTGAGLDTSGSRLYTSGQHLDTSGSRLNTSGQRVDFGDISGNTVVNQYGYDVHEVHTSGTVVPWPLSYSKCTLPEANFTESCFSQLRRAREFSFLFFSDPSSLLFPGISSCSHIGFTKMIYNIHHLF
ncbi:hypothetical protein ANCDUO_10377 [Ancylostoma duodenale]|uniref:Uncharacterized protein n=1 Tax=Ancylostoma duodenale TaxID=51022 RepID=A0A0C2GKL6_9BILA|nr:hypothetical protein ANCDUO_10377 [Ancylostoma duodenale]